MCTYVPLVTIGYNFFSSLVRLVQCCEEALTPLVCWRASPQVRKFGYERRSECSRADRLGSHRESRVEDELLGLKLTYYDNYLLTEVRAICELVVVDLVVEAPIVLLGLCRVLLGLLERREFEWRKRRSIKLGLGIVH